MTSQQVDRHWWVLMGDHEFEFDAPSYEICVARLEAHCIAEGIERRGAVFLDRQPPEVRT